MRSVATLEQKISVFVSILCVFSSLNVACVVSAFATDFPAMDLPSLDDAYDWSGFYLGGRAGYGFGHNHTSISEVPFDHASLNMTPSNVLIGGQFGYNFQLYDHYVVGLEGSVQSANDRDGRDHYPFVVSTRSHLSASLRGKVGYVMDRINLYATGGLSFADMHYHTYNTAPRWPAGLYFVRTDDHAQSQIGYTIGAGLDYALNDHWFVGTQYLYSDLSAYRYTPTNTLPQVSVKQQTRFHDVSAQLNYKF